MLKGEITSKLKSQKIKNFIIYGLGQGVNILSPLLITPYLIFVCGLEKLGVIADSHASNTGMARDDSRTAVFCW